MADAELGGHFESFTALVEQLGEAFVQLERQKDSSGSYLPLWEEIKKHLDNCQTSLKNNFMELQEKMREFEEKKSASDALLAEKKFALVEKELAMLDPLQELKDAAVAEIREALKKHEVDNPEPMDAVGNEENKVHISKGGNPSEHASALKGKSFGSRSDKSADVVAAEVKPPIQLLQLCEQMDATQFSNFISESKKPRSQLREEISTALRSATDPVQLVLNSLKNLYPMEHVGSSKKEKDTLLPILRRACLLLMESAVPVLGTSGPGDDHHLSTDAKQQAKKIADDWKAKLDRVDILDDIRSVSSEVLAFLQLLVNFQIASDFDQDELCKLALAVSCRRQTPDICRSLGLTHRIPGIIEELVSGGKYIDAVHFAHTFDLTKNFPPVPLLKAHLNKAINAQTGNLEAVAARDAIIAEVTALRVVIKCVQDYRLQSEYPLDPLQKQLTRVEKMRDDKKRAIQLEAEKSKLKKLRPPGAHPSSVPHFPSKHRQRPISLGFDDGGLYHGGSERYPYKIAAPSPGAAPSYNYQMPARSSYGPQNPQANMHRPYHQFDEWTPSAPFIGGGGGGSGASGHGSYFNSGLPSSQPYK